ncbi:IclR family transcriptional regulator [Luteimonas suaedae]|uniref:IclR family transcriptional regulator n=1 Tax=Luteimonas suaedae TaxID=2605430 RepID=UPI0011EC3902|nr:IclR family transcriptional regulator [Luteimonas suaedae]
MSTVASNLPKYRAPALDKGLDILELLARASAPMSMTEISEGVGRSKGEIFRMLQVLEERGYIARAPGESGYALTNRLFMLGMEQPPVKSAVEAALPVMHRLADRIQQPCHLVVPSREQIVVIARVDAPGDIGLVVRVGHRRPLAHSTSGLLLFAFQSEAIRARWLQMLLQSEPTLDQARFVERADQARALGYARAASDVVDGVIDLSAPVLQHDHAVCALTVPFIERHPARIGTDAVAAALCKAADEISHALMYGAGSGTAG